MSKKMSKKVRKKKLLKQGAAAALTMTVFFSSTPMSVFAAENTAATRGEVAQLLLNAADDYNPGVQKSDIIKGYADGELHEDQNVTRAESLVMLKRAFGDLPEPKGHNARVAIPAEQFTDVPDWAAAELKDVFDAGIVAGTSAGTFSPNEYVTIEQVKQFISRVFTLFGTNEKDDFYAAVNKEYLDNSAMKPGRSLGGPIYDLDDQVLEQTQEILDGILNTSHEKGTPEQKLTDLYKTVMDTDARNRAGYEPIKPYLEQIDKAQNIKDLIAAQSAAVEGIGCASFMGFSLTQDFADTTKYILYFGVSGPELDKASYEESDENKKQIYLDYIAKRLSLIDANLENEATPEEIYQFDQKLAEKKLAPEEEYDVDKVNNIYSFEQIAGMFGADVDMEEVFQNSGLKKEDRILIRDVGLVEEYARLFTNENLKVLKTKAKLDLVNTLGGLLSTDFIEASDQFSQDYRGIEGTYTDQERAIIALQNTMGTYISKAYVEKHFSEKEKNDITDMVHDILDVYRERIKNLDWMSETTKEKALKKLDTMGIKVGYPDDWKTPVDNAEIQSPEDGGSYFSNLMAIQKANEDYLISLQGTPVDKTEWVTDAYVVNAFYNPASNDITFPAAYLQVPVYDTSKSYEYNLGSTGYTIAHEITHAFDNNGAKFDENGNATDWWTAADYSAFTALCDDMAALYDGYEYAPGIATNGTLTLSENVADQGALSCIMEVASKLENPNYKDLFYSLGACDAVTTSREMGEYICKNDVHSLGRARTNRLVSNCPEFIEVFEIDETDGMYLAPEDQVRIW